MESRLSPVSCPNFLPGPFAQSSTVLGAYGYPVSAIAEDDLLREIARNASHHPLRLRCAVPADALVQGGLTIYGAECGRFPFGPTVIIDW
jgi:hypothetical protein